MSFDVFSPAPKLCYHLTIPLDKEEIIKAKHSPHNYAQNSPEIPSIVVQIDEIDAITLFINFSLKRLEFFLCKELARR